jgi:uncharacterized integral membrane protein
MSPYLLAGPAVALVGIVAVMFVMRHKSTEKRSMYSARRSQIEHKVKAARSRTLAPRGRSGKAPTPTEIAAAAPAAPVWETPAAAPRQAWEVGPATSAPVFSPPPAAAPPAYAPPAYTPPAAAPAEPFAPAPVEEPSWTPAPAEPSWTPTPAPAPSAPPPAEPASAPQRVATPAGGGASWSVVGEDKETAAEEPARKGKGKKKDKQAAPTGAAWQLASGDAPTEGGEAGEEVKVPNPAMAIAQYAVLVVGLVMVLIGVLVMVANSKVT